MSVELPYQIRQRSSTATISKRCISAVIGQGFGGIFYTNSATDPNSGPPSGPDGEPGHPDAAAGGHEQRAFATCHAMALQPRLAFQPSRV